MTQDFKERRDWVNKFSNQESDARFSDATLQVLNNNNLVNFDVVFKQLFPIELTSLPFDVTQTDNEYFTATAMFKYMTYEVRNKNSQKRR